MAKTKIEWTATVLDDGTVLPGYTFNPWWGCTKVSAGCDNCYAATFDHRVGGDHWGPGKPRREMSDAYWQQPLAWQKAATASKRRMRVFCASMADVFDSEAPAGVLGRLWATVRATPSLDWLLLTKRPQRIHKSLPADWGAGWPNVWLGTSIEDQRHAETRIPYLLAVTAAVHFLSCEPLLGPLDIRPWLRDIDWVIVGGESGHGAREFDLKWARSLVTQCREANTAPFVKQLGAKPVCRTPESLRTFSLRDPKGGDMDEWPTDFADLRVRDWPR